MPPLNANKIATILNLDHKTVVHHVEILSRNELIVKADKACATEFEITQIMKKNQDDGTDQSNPAVAEDGIIISHAGIVGDADLLEDVHEWGNPVVKIDIARIN